MLTFLNDIKKTNPIQLIGNKSVEKRGLFKIYEVSKKKALFSSFIFCSLITISNSVNASEFFNDYLKPSNETLIGDISVDGNKNWYQEENVLLTDQPQIITPIFSNNPGISVPIDEWGFYGFNNGKFIDFVEKNGFNLKEAYLYYSFLETFSSPRMLSSRNVELPEKIGIEFRYEISKRLMRITSPKELEDFSKWMYENFLNEIVKINENHCNTSSEDYITSNHPCYIFLNSIARIDKTEKYLFTPTILINHDDGGTKMLSSDYYGYILEKNFSSNNFKNIQDIDFSNISLIDGLNYIFKEQENNSLGITYYNNESIRIPLVNNSNQQINPQLLKDKWIEVLEKTQLNMLELPLISNLETQYGMLNEILLFSNELEKLTGWEGGVLGLKGRLNLYYTMNKPFFHGNFGVTAAVCIPVSGVRTTIISDRDSLLHEYFHFLEFTAKNSISENKDFVFLLDKTYNLQQEITQTQYSFEREEIVEKLKTTLSEYHFEQDRIDLILNIQNKEEFLYVIHDLYSYFQQEISFLENFNLITQTRNDLFKTLSYITFLNQEHMNIFKENEKEEKNYFSKRLLSIEYIQKMLEEDNREISEYLKLDFNYWNRGDEIRARSLATSDFSFLNLDKNIIQPNLISDDYLSPVGGERLITGKIYNEYFLELKPWWNNLSSVFYMKTETNNNISNEKNQNNDFLLRLSLIRKSDGNILSNQRKNVF